MTHERLLYLAWNTALELWSKAEKLYIEQPTARNKQILENAWSECMEIQKTLFPNKED